MRTNSLPVWTAIALGASPGPAQRLGETCLRARNFDNLRDAERQ